MLHQPPATSDRSELTGIIREIRNRWRLKLALRGAAFVITGFLLTLLLSAYALETLRFSPGSIIAFRVAMVMIFGALAVYFFVLPQWRRVSDEQVALYLEECEPSLETAILSALEAEKHSTSHSPELARRLVQQAIERCGMIERGRRLEARPLRRYGVAIGGSIAAAFALLLLGPAYLWQGASALLLMADVLEASPYRIDVKPGSATVPRGSDQMIRATVQGFESDKAQLLIRKSLKAPFEHVPMVFNGDTKAFEGMLFDLPGSIDYFVESGGVRSSVFTIHAADLPYVKQLEMEYLFPAYTGLAPRKIENGGDIAVLQGTNVRLRVTPTMAAPSGRILIDGATAIALTSEGGVFTATIPVAKDGFYRIELQGGPENKLVNASPQYTIDVLEDQAPTVAIAKPGRDTTASPIEEFSIEARADDDFGVRQLQLVYSVNGGPEQVKTLVDSRTRPLSEVSAAHTFYLEELKVEPGDSVSYYAKVVDNDSVRGGKAISSDLYFVRIRKLDEQFRSAMSMGGGGGGGGGGGNMQADALSQQQREIISATHNIVRDRKTMTPQKLRENLVVVALSQAKLREQVDGLVGRMNSRLVEPDPAFQRIAELLPKAAAEMRAAEAKLQAQAPTDALPPENRALQQLQKVEEEYEKQVSQQSAGGGGGGGAGSVSEDLAELFKQDLDKLANQYETAQSAQQQQSDQQLDALMEKLRELARRQQQEAERQRQQALAGQLAQGGGTSQRALAEQADEAARQLERLSRERNRPDLAQAAQQMRQAADAMRRAASSGDPSSAGQASAALGQLREAQRRLEQEQGARGQRDMEAAQQQAEEIAREHRELSQEALSMTQGGGGRSERAMQNASRKYQLEAKVNELEKQLDRMSGEMRRTERDASRKLQEAADGIRDNRLEERIRYSGSLMRAAGQTDPKLEADISTEIDGLRRKLGEASKAVGQGSKDNRMANNLDRARNLVRGVDSMQQQMRDAQQGQQGQRGQQGQEGQQGQRGQEGQQGQQGQQSGQGQQGAQGQQGQGQAQDGQGSQNARADGEGAGSWNRGDPAGWGQRVYTPQEIRDFRNQARYWTGEAQRLRDQLRNDGVNAADLDEVLRQMRQLDDERTYKDAAELARLQTHVAEGLKRFEFALRRKAEGANVDQPALVATDEVPRGFRDLVEEYYRSLSRNAK